MYPQFNVEDPQRRCLGASSFSLCNSLRCLSNGNLQGLPLHSGGELQTGQRLEAAMECMLHCLVYNLSSEHG